MREVIARRIETIMGKRLGHMIREFREKQGRTIEEAARGLLSAAELSRVENGTKEIEYLIMEALFETYGKSLDKLEIVVSSDEYRILELRLLYKIVLKFFKFANAFFFKIFYTVIHREHLSFVCILVVSLKYFITKLGVL